jgi:hypothetical protein
MGPPDGPEVELLSRGVTAAIAPSTGLTEIQRTLIAEPSRPSKAILRLLRRGTRLTARVGPLFHR